MAIVTLFEDVKMTPDFFSVTCSVNSYGEDSGSVPQLVCFYSLIGPSCVT
jgi:hypothetical protein